MNNVESLNKKEIRDEIEYIEAIMLERYEVI